MSRTLSAKHLSAFPEQLSSISGKQPALRRAIDKYLNDNGIEIRPSHEVDNLGGVMSLIPSTGALRSCHFTQRPFFPTR